VPTSLTLTGGMSIVALNCCYTFHRCFLCAVFVTCTAEDAGAEGELWQALGMPNSPFEVLPELPDLIRRDLYGPLDLLLALAGHLARVRTLVTAAGPC
jgi:hypothetical protein